MVALFFSIEAAAAAAGTAAPEANDGDRMECEGPLLQQPQLQQGLAAIGRSNTGALTARKADVAGQDMDAENKTQGGGGLFIRGGGRSSSSSRGRPPLSDMISSFNAFNSLGGGPSAATRGPPSAAVMRKFPTSLIQIQRS
jgi:hypothetical protein